ncbi:hypothetical protein C8F04DRAFT_163783 [Mycena alexandri]|uniref:BTB domain-containing protein n=1 Tax=Mycena alexandri TaxID=1745969 RepID=A0AAD6SCU5_9AGAR|nr:hypothetical protein C8F04DRAFT_163783 [Mycena alexandri]
MPENFRERADLTKIIKSILDSYPLGNGILRELLQNSDDASATEQTFILDMRTHPSRSVVDQDLVGCQGPALLAVNDTLFSESDWKAISTLHSSSKTTDETKIGKFGIGVRACYHITDNPQFLSGRKLVIFDPHERFSSGQEGGVRIDVLTEGTTYPDQLAPFDKSLQPDAAGFFPGTVVRLPLRTGAQALKSTIKPTIVDASLIETLFEEFVEKELSVVMLFLKHIRYICLKVISPDGRERFIGSAEIPDLSIAEKRTFSRNTGARQETFRCTINVTSSNRVATSQVWRICHAVRSTEETSGILTRRLEYNVGSKLADDKLFSHVSVAFPLEPTAPNFSGRLFTLLPLPIHTGFPVHMHGILALTQDRQSLRNIEETGTGAESRERLLVTWNRTIFDEFLPRTWSTLLQTLVDNNEVDDIWAAWPALEHATNGSGYWSEILPNLIKQVLDLDLPIFPIFPDAGSYVSLSSAFIASENDDVDVLRALSKVGLAIVKFPQTLQKVLPFASGDRLLHPIRVRRALTTRNILTLATLADADKDHILRYLVVAPGSVLNVIGLPLVPLIRGGRTSLPSSTNHVLATQQEGDIFGDFDCNGDLVSLSSMPPVVAQVFLASQMSNIVRLNNNHVREYLNILFGAFNPAEDEIVDQNTSSKVEWLIRFWKWFAGSTWEDKNGLLLLVNRFHLLPTAQGTLRKMESRILLPLSGPSGPRTMAAWGILRVHFLHPDVAPYSMVFKSSTVVGSDIQFLLSSMSAQCISSLDSNAGLLIQDHLVQSLGSRRPSVRLSPLDQRNFLRLPIFPIRVAVPNARGGRKLSRRDVGAAFGTLVFVRVDDSCPVPITPNGTTFFDVTSKSGVLGTIIDAAGIKRALDELGVLEMAVNQLATQPRPVLDALLSRIIHRLSEFSAAAKDKLQHVPFVSVIGSTDYVCPAQVIDPRSDLAALYDGEANRLPTGRWGQDPALSLFTSHGFFQRKITAAIVTERMEYLTRKWPRQEFPRIFHKAQTFLRLLDQSWPSIEASIDVKTLAGPWMPVREDASLVAPAACRDNNEKLLLFDLVLSVVNGTVHNKALRKFLGWDGLSMSILGDQLQRALTHSKNRTHRLHALIMEYSRRFATLSAQDIEYLMRTVSDQPWVPVSPTEIVETKHALLRPTRLRGRFRTVPRTLLEASNGQGFIFLERIGCTVSPSLDTLLTELQVLVARSGENVNSGVIFEAIDMLKEIAAVLPDVSEGDYERIFVPGNDGFLHPIAQVYFLDFASDFRPETGLPTHPEVSEALARDLGVQFLSSLELDDDDDDDDDLQMGEDFTKRVEGVLKEHDVQYALNEFMANAIDAKATTFSVLLDERTFESSKVLAPGLSDLQRRPALFLYNDATFSEADFRGLREVGQGGKTSNPDSIGRYGLGALSLFHFTDVVQIVSNRRLLILDPSGTHLPPMKGRSRTSVLKDLSKVVRRYPDQLSPFESIHGFSKHESFYSGTLFRLPLRDEASVLSSTVLRVPDCLNLINGPYFGLARDATYFTCLEHISAAQQAPMGSRSLLWSIDAERPPIERHDDHEIVCVKTSGHGRPASSQIWLVTKSATPISVVPPAYTGVLVGMGLHESKIGVVVRIALLLEDFAKSAGMSLQPGVRPKPVPTYSLFSTLRLPVQTSLPAHVSAQFAISSDRRHIRFEPPDISGNRIPQAAFNSWILDTLIPPLYISTLYYVAGARRSATRAPAQSIFPWWPGSNGNNEDSISRVVVQAFYELIPKSPLPICNTVTGQLVAPMAAVFSADRTPIRVQDVLRMLRAPKFVELPYRIHKLVLGATTTTAAGSPELRFVDASFVQDVLAPRTSTFRELYTNKHISVPTIDTILLFLLKGGVTASDLPLLVAADGTLTHGNSQRRPIYVCRGDIPDIFWRSDFLHGTMDQETQDLLLQTPNMNVKIFDVGGALALLREQIPPGPRCLHSHEIRQWISRFWESYNHLPGPPSPALLDPFPLISTANGEHISLEYCRRDDVITEPLGRPALVSAMQRMELIFCQIPEPLRSSFDKAFTLKAFLKAIRSKSYPFNSLSPEETREIGSWIRSNVYTCTDSESRTILKSLPIWEARKDNRTVLLNANELEMLPNVQIDGLNLKTFDGYTRSGIALANFDWELETVRSWPPSSRSLNSERLAQLLLFPDVLQVFNIPSYLNLLTAFLSLGGAGKIPVPDGNLRLRPADCLYDHSVELFAVALQSCERTVFLHPTFRRLHQFLREKGLQFVVGWESFLLCARTVDEDLTARFLPEALVVPRAEMVYRFFNSDLPGIVMTNTSRWRQLDGLRFILRDARRSSSSSYTTDPYCEDLPEIVTPSQILQKKYEQIAWTQRALFQEEPMSGLIALNKSLGVPTAMEIVNHLKVLVQRVAPEHPGNRALIQQLSATYEWLNENKEAARPYLRATGAIFLNVEDPLFGPWEWRSAEQLLFDVEYDWPETNTFRVRRFLQDFRPLLLAAGADSEHAVDYRPRTTAVDGNTLREAFDAMRTAGQLTDLVLMPSETMGEDMEVEALRAHSTFLAAAIPHVRDALLGWRESTSESYSFPGTYFGARAVLDFVYTGKIEPNPGQTGDGHMDLLRDLLELLGDADEWNMPELKDEIGRLVKEWRLLSRDTYWMIIRHAEKYQATSLLDYCREWGNKNPTALRRNADSDEEEDYAF